MSWFTQYKSSLKMVEVEEVFDLFFYRPLAFILVKTIYSTNITPNHLTIISIIFGITAGCVYATGSPASCLYGAIFFTLYNIIDCSDGQLARLKKNGTHTGRIIDGSADYITAAAVFIGLGIGFPDQSYDHKIWWLLLAAAAVSNTVQSILVDYYRNRFLNYILQRKNSFDEMQSFSEEYQKIKSQKNKWFDKWLIKTYLKYLSLQSNLAAKTKEEKIFNATSQEYYKKNKTAMRFWVSIGPTSQVSALIICSAITRFDIYFWITIGLFNAIAAIMWIVQRHIDKSLQH
ncbi:MAG: CDP-alcohol phosphatidyltransferase family protein [Ginsengibacter sp.]